MKKAIILIAALSLILTGCNCSKSCKDHSCDHSDAVACAHHAAGEQCDDCAQHGSNAVIDAIMGRRSIRKYKDTPVDRETLLSLAVCGVNAPNAINAQNWEVRIIDSKEYIDGITDIYKAEEPRAVEMDKDFKNMFRNAPAVIAVAIPEGEDGVNAGLLGENIMLAAYSLGLGTCCLGGPARFMTSNPKAAPYLAKLNFSEGYKLLYLIAVGYPDENPDAKPRDLNKIDFVE